MIGAVIITHGGLAECLVSAVEGISGKHEHLKSIDVKYTDTTDSVRDVLKSSIAEVDAGKGVIIFTDMFGGTPTNIALSFFNAGKVEIITGVNLPLLLKFVSYRPAKPLSELAVFLRDYGRSTIILAGDMLHEKGPDPFKGLNPSKE